jgi:hypothetical protein
MRNRMCRVLACLTVVALLGGTATMRGQEVEVPGETYPPEWIGAWVIDNYAARQAQSVAVCEWGGGFRLTHHGLRTKAF